MADKNINISDLNRMGKAVPRVCEIERLVGPLFTKRGGFIYDTEDETDYYPVRPGKMFWIVYKKDKSETFMTDKWEVILPIRHYWGEIGYVNWMTDYSRYRKAKPSVNREVYLKPYQLIITKKHLKNEFITRAFAKELHKKEQSIFEINPTHSGIETPFYKTVSVKWKIQGTKEEILKYNTEEFNRANKLIYGISDYLDPLELYQEPRRSHLEILKDKIKNTMEIQSLVDEIINSPDAHQFNILEIVRLINQSQLDLSSEKSVQTVRRFFKKY